MKVLSVQQPWASLIVAGIKDVENRTWKPKEMPGRILVHASKKCSILTMGKEPVEWVQEILNEITFGNLPDFPEMPDGAIIGYVTVDSVDKDNASSIWAAGESNDERLYYWHLKDAFIFDEPITGVKGKLHLWDYDLDENNLPATHQVKLVGVEVEDDHVFIPVIKDIWDKLQPNGSFAIELGSPAVELCLPDVYDLKPLKTITFIHDGQQRSFALRPETEWKYYTDGSEDQNPAMYLSLLNPEDAARNIAYFIWGEELK